MDWCTHQEQNIYNFLMYLFLKWLECCHKTQGQPCTGIGGLGMTASPIFTELLGNMTVENNLKYLISEKTITHGKNNLEFLYVLVFSLGYTSNVRAPVADL